MTEERDYLRIKYDYRLPLLVYSEKETEVFLTCLEAWKLMEAKKVAARIPGAENTI